MDEATFWKLIEGARTAMTSERANQSELLQEELEKLPHSEIIEFDRIFRRLHNDAHSWALRAAAHTIIEGGCGGDDFADFRAGVIGLGRDAYYAALRDPESLAQVTIRGVDIFQDDLLYTALFAYQAVTGAEELPDPGLPHPEQPAGEYCDEATALLRYPVLAAKFRSGT